MKVKIINKSAFPLPAYETTGASGMDVRTNIEEPYELTPGARHVFSTGLFMELPQGIECQVRPRSGMALKKGITVINTPGTIDADYRGEVGVILINHSKEVVSIEPGERIAQLVFCPIIQVTWLETTELNASKRGEGGFGSTGLI